MWIILLGFQITCKSAEIKSETSMANLGYILEAGVNDLPSKNHNKFLKISEACFPTSQNKKCRVAPALLYLVLYQN
jgi:hypothetical protein